MRTTRSLILANLTALAALVAVSPAFADALLSGTIKGADGKPMGGVTVSAKPDGGTITTTVFTDEAGQYFFPELPAGHYRVWAQALSFKTAKDEVDLTANRNQDFSLSPMNDAEATFKQLPGNLVLDALPDSTPEQQRMKRIVRNVCTGCHTPSFPLQNRFDETGWNAIIGLMKNVNVYGTYLGPEHKPSGILEFHQKELAAYLAAARGPVPRGANRPERIAPGRPRSPCRPAGASGQSPHAPVPRERCGSRGPAPRNRCGAPSSVLHSVPTHPRPTAGNPPSRARSAPRPRAYSTPGARQAC